MLHPCWTHIGHQHPETHVSTYQTHHVACPFLIIIFWGHFTDTCFLCLEVKKNKNTATYTFVPYIYNCPKFIFIYIANTNIKKKFFRHISNMSVFWFFKIVVSVSISASMLLRLSLHLLFPLSLFTWFLLQNMLAYLTT